MHLLCCCFLIFASLHEFTSILFHILQFWTLSIPQVFEQSLFLFPFGVYRERYDMLCGSPFPPAHLAPGSKLTWVWRKAHDEWWLCDGRWRLLCGELKKILKSEGRSFPFRETTCSIFLFAQKGWPSFPFGCNIHDFFLCQRAYNDEGELPAPWGKWHTATFNAPNWMKSLKNEGHLFFTHHFYLWRSRQVLER